MTDRKFTWQRDGDQWTARGRKGVYRITEWCAAAGSSFLVSVETERGRPRGFGDHSSLAAAKAAVAVFDETSAR